LKVASASATTSNNDNWTTYHYDSTRDGYDPATPVFSGVHEAWTSPELDGNIYAEPLVYDGVVFIATENDTVYALSAADGTILWSKHVGSAASTSFVQAIGQIGTDCGIAPSMGITSTPVIDASLSPPEIFVSAEEASTTAVSHHLLALDLDTGSIISDQVIDPPSVSTDGIARLLQRPALALDDGRVLIGFGSLSDCGTYNGWLLGASETDPDTAPTFYELPSQSAGTIWASSGPAVDPATGHIYVATGNSSAMCGQPFDDGNAVIEFSPSLEPLSVFAPSDWCQRNAQDLDLGSAGPLILPGGEIFQLGKNGANGLPSGFLLNESNLGGIGGQQFSGPACFSDGGQAYYAGRIYASCTYATDVVLDYTSGPEPSFALDTGWNPPTGANSPPIIAGGLVWVLDTNQGILYALDPVTAAVLGSFNIGTTAHFATPSAGAGLVFAANSTSNQVFAFGSGPPAQVTLAGAFVGRLYEDALGRAPTASELAGATASLQDNGVTPGQIAQLLTSGSEYATDQVDDDYEQYLGSLPISAEATPLVDAIVSGDATYEDVLATVLGSTAFFDDTCLDGTCGTDSSYVNALFTRVLEQPGLATSTDIAYWAALLADGIYNPTTMAEAFLTSKLGKTALVTTWYQQYLGRAPESNEPLFEYLVAALDQPGVTDQTIIALITGTQEFQADAG
jgi:outer membrane protein assembly factor BamB